ncbi:Unknown protein [Striga hermonthica]|uniref:Uncharacterized protein n=1 Tax=Striga hermonthica TaxID=68872 RepID=A0A9N7REI7_STRHE|nr:Unknown protein [Striga hermonthica]
MEIELQGCQRGKSAARAWPTTRALGGLMAPTAVISQSRTRVKLNRVFFPPLIPPSPFPWLWFSWIVDRDSGNLVNPFIRIPLVRTSSESAVDRAGKAPEGAVPSLSPGRHATTRSRRVSSSSSSPIADGFGAGTPAPSPQSQSFSRGYRSIFPTSLAYIVPSTRGCSPWRPDAVMSTTGHGRHMVLWIFKGRRGRTGHHGTCGALPAAGTYLRLSRFQAGQAVKQKR